MTWPVAEFDNVRRLRVLQRARPDLLIAETVLGTPFDDVWSDLDNIESTLPEVLPDVRSLRVLTREGERIRAEVRGYSGLRGTFDMVMRPGWCFMQSRLLVFGMAAAPEGEHTRFAYVTGLRLPGRRLYTPVLRPWHGRLARATLQRFENRFGRV